MTTGEEAARERRFRIHHGMDRDNAGYVVVDSSKTEDDWRGKVVFSTDSQSDATAKADELNALDEFVDPPLRMRRTYDGGLLDITAPAVGVQVELRNNPQGGVLWVTVDGITVLRVCQIPLDNPAEVIDARGVT